MRAEDSEAEEGNAAFAGQRQVLALERREVVVETAGQGDRVLQHAAGLRRAARDHSPGRAVRSGAACRRRVDHRRQPGQRVGRFPPADTSQIKGSAGITQ